MQADPFQANRELESELCAYTGAPFAVVVNSCTMAILLACAWFRQGHNYADEVSHISLPKHTYIGVPYAVREAGFGIEWRDEDWQGQYWLDPLPVLDAARRFTGGMFAEIASAPAFQCVSFHHAKILGHTQAGAILHSDPMADIWFRKARFDGRTEGIAPADDHFNLHRAFHCYLSPDVAAALRWKLASLPRHNADLPRDNYPDLSKFPIFQERGIA